MLFCPLLTLITYLFLNINFRLSRAYMRICVKQGYEVRQKNQLKNTLMPIIFFYKNTYNR